MEEEEPVTPMGRLCLLPEHNHIINCAIVLENPIDIDALKQELSNSIMIKIPRFSCIMTADPRDRSEFWKRVHVDLDNHIIIHNNHIDDNNNYNNNEYDGMSDEDVVNSYLADMAISSPMRMDKPLWEIHVLHAQKCMIIRVHHAIADGMSLMSLLWTMGRRSSRDNNKIYNMVTNSNNVISDKKKLLDYSNKEGKGWKSMGLWESLVYVWNTLVFELILVGRCLWVKDKGVISGFTGVEFWPRKIATAKFKISDMKSIKKAIPNATVHEVLCGIIWCGLTRYLNMQYPKDLPEGVQITGMCPFNLRQQPGVQDVAKMLTKNTRSPWGNRFSVILLPFTYRKKCMDPLSYVALAKELMAKKKRSMEARLSYNIVSLASSLLGSKVPGFFYYNLFCNTSFLLPNIAGPLETISMGDNPVTSIRVTPSSQPHAMTMHLVSYLEWANLQIQVAKDVIPDPKALAKYFEDALFDMKEAAERM